MTENETLSEFKDSIAAAELENIDAESLSEDDAETLETVADYLRSR